MRITYPRLRIMVTSVIFLLAILASSNGNLFIANAEGVNTINSPQSTNIKDPGFKLIVCDGPAQANSEKDPKYVPCDFNGLMKTIQHLINVAMVAGVVVAIFGFCYAGFLYITSGSQPNKRTEASKIFKNIGLGFIIMLSAWFIVYQILSWLTGDSGFSALLGKPSKPN
jgi:hypothetical protein